ncbi:MAG: ISL3 family transposase [Erysipelotrichaceae bacterium]|nr:ISL3 family transposase [Erysipelotrichaceae bacterium]
MSLNRFVSTILNISPDRILDLDVLEHQDSSVSVYVRLIPDSTTVCPLCKGNVYIHGYTPRKLVHAVLSNRNCTIHYRQRRYRCRSCEYTFKENNPFINSSENLTYETKINILKDLKAPNMTYTYVSKRYNVSTTKVLRLFDKHVSIPRKTLPEVLSMDEHYFPESDYDSLYCCLLMDFNTGELIDVLPDRKKEYLDYYFNDIRNSTLDASTSSSELDNVKYLSIDLYEPYKDIALQYFKDIVICADSFHVLEHLTKAFRNVRLKCRRSTQDEDIAYLLTKFSYVFDHDTDLDNAAKYNKRFHRYLNRRQIQEICFRHFPELKKAYDLKEGYIHFNNTATVSNAAELLAAQIVAFADCGIREYIEFYNLLIHWNKEIVNSFTIINGRRINNSYIESRNRLLELLIQNANGFRNFKRTRNRILYCFNKNDNFKI